MDLSDLWQHFSQSVLQVEAPIVRGRRQVVRKAWNLNLLVLQIRDFNLLSFDENQGFS